MKHVLILIAVEITLGRCWCCGGGFCLRQQSPCAGTSRYLRHVADLLRADGSLDVDGVGLDLLQVLPDDIVVHLDPLRLALPSEGQPGAAVGVRVGGLGLVLAVVQHALQLRLVPTGEIVAVENLQKSK